MLPIRFVCLAVVYTLRVYILTLIVMFLFHFGSYFRSTPIVTDLDNDGVAGTCTHYRIEKKEEEEKRIGMGMCVCVRERERQRDRETGREKGRERERERRRERGRERESEVEKGVVMV